jgi:predicted O-methyltransferase YrrM
VTSLLTAAKINVLDELARSVSHLGGAAAEVGVYKGGSAVVIARALPGRRLYLFDTFEGLPEPGPEDGMLRQGHFAGSVEDVTRTLSDHVSGTFSLVLGVFPHSAKGLEAERFAFVHVDVDLAESHRAACEWFAPRMVPGGLILFDDYGCPFTPGAKPAVDAFFGDRVTDTGLRQGVVRF